MVGRAVRVPPKLRALAARLPPRGDKQFLGLRVPRPQLQMATVEAEAKRDDRVVPDVLRGKSGWAELVAAEPQPFVAGLAIRRGYS